MKESEEESAPTEHKPIHVPKMYFLLEEQKDSEQNDYSYWTS